MGGNPGMTQPRSLIQRLDDVFAGFALLGDRKAPLLFLRAVQGTKTRCRQQLYHRVGMLNNDLVRETEILPPSTVFLPLSQPHTPYIHPALLQPRGTQRDIK
ncbi:Hypothetical predicted protein [Pelobates cultripes]|uniref:Uncharacterized protein n=1 Tax=Pelobates cultripes TaxID=61616 RepID=A0AAD1SC82_PELCU|nr:Hypothetical predicted protein [Pelobates cultripes]